MPRSWPFRSRDVIVHVTIWFPVVIFYRCSIGTKCVSPTVIEVMGPKYIGVMTLIILGHVTSSFTWPFESQWVISYWWSIGPKSLSPSVFEIFGVTHIEVTTLTFLGHVTSSVTPLFESQVVISYRYSIGTKSVSPTIVEIMGPKYIGSRTWPFWVMWRHQSRDHSNPNGASVCRSVHLLVVHTTQVSISIRFRDIWPYVYWGHELDLSGSRDVISHVTFESQWVISY